MGADAEHDGAEDEGTTSGAAPGGVAADGAGPSAEQPDPGQAEQPDPGQAEQPDPGHIAAELAATLAGVADAVRELVEQWHATSGGSLAEALPDLIAELLADPLLGLTELGRRLGVRFPGAAGRSAEELAAYARDRFRGEYAIDEFGFDPELTVNLYLPVLRFLARNWFRIEVRGAENIPTDGSALLVSNHAGALPLDAMMLQSVVFDEIGRHVRLLAADLVFKTPFSHDLARKTGSTLACQEDAERLLTTDQLVGVFPEGFKGLGKPYSDRYRLQRFGRGGFVSAAVRAQVPIVPVSIVGSEEIYPLLSTAPTLARALGLPYFPVTPLFPWFGLLGAIPLPSKWIISFGEVIATDELPPGAADDPMVVFDVTDQVRETIQHALYALLMDRRGTFW